MDALLAGAAKENPSAGVDEIPNTGNALLLASTGLILVKLANLLVA